MRRRASGSLRLWVALLTGVAVGAACAAAPEPSSITPAPSAPATTGGPTRSDAVLAIGLDADPVALSAGAGDAASRRVVRLVFDPLYRLDDRLVPTPALASALPESTPDGLRWTIRLREGVRFHDGSPLTADDVAFTYRLAVSPNCPFGDTCAHVRDTLRSVTVRGASEVELSLERPAAPFLATVLSELPVLSRPLVEASVQRFVAGGEAVGLDRANQLVERVTGAVNAPTCVSAAAPAECRIATYVPDLEALHRDAGLSIPDPARFRTIDGAPDPEAYGAALLARVQLLAGALAARDEDRAAAAFALLDIQSAPVGTGPFAFRAHVPGQRVELTRHDGYFGGAPTISGIRAVVNADPAAAATALKTGDLDWVPSLSAEQLADMQDEPGVRVASHPDLSYRAIVFNVRPGRVYEQVATRQAFALCLDKAAMVAAATAERGIPAWSPVIPSSWAASEAVPRLDADPGRARSLLERSGWQRGADGVYARRGVRLSSEILVRPGRADQAAFAQQAAERLRTCGIELRVRELDVSGGALLDQVEFPNEFDTVLVSRDIGLDPDTALSVFEGSRVTTRENPGDANFGGWSSSAADQLLRSARANLDQSARARAYASLEVMLASELPEYPLWYEVTHAGLRSRVSAPDGEVDLRRAGYDWDVARWALRAP